MIANWATITSYPTSASGVIVLLKTPPKYRKLDYNRSHNQGRRYKALEKFSKALYGATGGTYGARVFRPVMVALMSRFDPN